ncbi:hypothetical protein K501DRAFT_279536 [Backusella circina FSU 941]|nr:hypothetical protein K501DRAFT_279536 [Backusella circina FSU 941]
MDNTSDLSSRVAYLEENLAVVQQKLAECRAVNRRSHNRLQAGSLNSQFDQYQQTKIAHLYMLEMDSLPENYFDFSVTFKKGINLRRTTELVDKLFRDIHALLMADHLIALSLYVLALLVIKEIHIFLHA